MDKEIGGGYDQEVSEEGINTWQQFKEQQPELALALSVLPVSGQIIAAKEYYTAMQEGDTKNAVLSALQFIPVIGRGLRSFGGAIKNGDEAAALEPLLETFGGAKIFRNSGLTVADVVASANQRAADLSKEVASSVVSSGANAFDYLQSKMTQAFNESRGN